MNTPSLERPIQEMTWINQSYELARDWKSSTHKILFGSDPCGQTPLGNIRQAAVHGVGHL